MKLCRCQDCMNQFYNEKSHHHTDVHGLYHHNNCNHITEKEFDSIEFESEEWDEELEMYIVENRVHWHGYRCNCEQINKEEEE
mgnify:FL=1